MKTETKLKLYVWSDFSPDYKGGLAFAIAADEVEARKLVVHDLGYEPMDWGKLKIYPTTKRVGRAVVGGG